MKKMNNNNNILKFTNPALDFASINSILSLSSLSKSEALDGRLLALKDLWLDQFFIDCLDKGVLTPFYYFDFELAFLSFFLPILLGYYAFQIKKITTKSDIKREAFIKFNNSVSTSCTVLLSFTLVSFLMKLCNNFEEFTQAKNYWSFLLFTDIYSIFAKIFLIIIGICVLQLYKIQVSSVINFKKIKFEVPLIITFAILGCICIISCYDLMALFITLEGISLCLYILSAYRVNNELSVESGVKYFSLGSASSGLLLFGIFTVYLGSGTTNFATIKETINFIIDVNFTSPYLYFYGVIFIVLGFAFKLGAAPFHAWIPEVYKGIPLIVTLFFATVVKFTMLITFIRIVYYVFPLLGVYNVINFKLILISLGFISIWVGALGAYYQETLKKMLAFSSINQIGWIFLCLSCNSITGVESALYYIIIYIITMIIVFATIIYLKAFRQRRLFFITDFGNLGYSNPSHALIFSISLLSLGGLPPFLGFFAKWKVIVELMTNELYLISIFIILSAIVSIFYYSRIIKNMYFHNLVIEEDSFINELNEDDPNVVEPVSLSNILFFIFYGILIAIIVFGIFCPFLLDLPFLSLVSESAAHPYTCFFIDNLKNL